MRLFFLVRLAAAAGVAAVRSYACSCGGNPATSGKSSWEAAKVEAERATAIFEGTTERQEMQWKVVNAKEGELIPAGFGDRMDNYPRMLVMLRVQRVYKGVVGPKVQLRTGMGGGDCGRPFHSGLTYLLYVYGPNPSEWGASICGPGGWIGSGGVATDLRYLRKEPPIASDLAPPQRPRRVKTAVELEEQRQRDLAELGRYEAATGRICGTVLQRNTTAAHDGTISFLSTTGSSPVDHPRGEVRKDGSFCSDRLGPDRYYLYFTSVSDDGKRRSALYYPGVTDRQKATTIEIRADQTQSNITFKVPLQKTYSVRGFISTNDKSGLDADDGHVFVGLVRLDGAPQEARYGQTIDFRGSIPLLNAKYFNFENVLPGRYVAWVTVRGRDWYTKKVEVNVTTHMNFIFLQLVHKK
jgi:hypothetical protein